MRTILVFLLVLLAACGGAAPARAPAPMMSRTMPAAMPEAAPGSTGGAADEESDAPTRGDSSKKALAPAGGAGKEEPTAAQAAAPRTEPLLVYEARLTVAVYQVDPAMAAVEKIARSMGGYLSLRSDREITIRVPRERFQEALKAVEPIGDVLHRDIRAEDVTDEFRDLDTRLKNARAMRDRLQDLLAKAAVKEALEIERELGRITEEIERLSGKLKLLSDRIAYSRITVSFQPRTSEDVHADVMRLPFPWLSDLGLGRLLNLH